MKKWRCTICGYVHEGEEPPEKCPVCGADKSLFEEIVETPPAAEAAGEQGPAVESAPGMDTPVKKWRCTVCGYVHDGEEPPAKCPVCGADKSLFEAVVETPAAAEAAEEKGPEAGSKASQDPRAIDLGPEPDTPLGRIRHTIMGQMLKHHAHPISVHFPNGVLPVAFIFMLLAMLFESRALATAAYCNLVFVVIALPAVLYSGYVEWQKRYKGLRSRQFTIKIACAAVVFGLALLAVIWWTVNPDVLSVPSAGRTLFVLINLLSLGAAGIAGLIGGKLVFRD